MACSMNPTTFTLLINAAPFTSQGSNTAYQFAKAVLSKGHKLLRIFFYEEGVYNGNSFIKTPQDEVSIVSVWQQLAEEHGTELVICVAAAQRRGVLDDSESQSSNLANEFKISGLGQLIEAAMTADRFVVFN